ncbi:MAG: glutathione S-transferase family protein [Pseudomonadota bacterium]
MKFYCAPRSISVASGLLLEEAGLDYEPILLDFSKNEQTLPEYLAINPKGRVPALVTQHGILTETGAIAEYIATSAPDLNLVPRDTWQAAQMRAICYYLASTFHVNHAHRRRGHRWASEDDSLKDMSDNVPRTMAESCAYIEATCALDPFVMGEAFTIADPWLFTICLWLESDEVDISRFPRLEAHFERIAARPSVASIRAYGLLA